MLYDNYTIRGVLIHADRKNHKYIDKIKTKTGKWRYIYDYTLAKGNRLKKSAELLVNNKIKNVKIQKAYSNYDINEDTGDVYRKNERYEKVTNDIITNSKYDRDSGLAIKKKVYTIDEDIKNVNPRGKDSQTGEDSSTRYAEINCELCSLTYALRRKGYNVTAGLTDGIEVKKTNEYKSNVFRAKDGRAVANTYKVYDPVKKDLRIISEEKAAGYYDEELGVPRSVWYDAKDGKNTFYVDYIIDDIIKFPKGSYGTFTYGGPYGGHAANWEITDKGQLLFINSQENQIYDHKMLQEQLGHSGYYSYCRLDDKEIIKEKGKGFDFIKKYIISDTPNKILEALPKMKILNKKLENYEGKLEPKMERTPKSYDEWRKEKQKSKEYELEKWFNEQENKFPDEWRDYQLPNNKNIIEKMAEAFDDLLYDFVSAYKRNSILYNFLDELIWNIKYRW